MQPAQPRPPRLSRFGTEPAAVAPHDLMNIQHATGSALLIHNIGKEPRTLFRGGDGAQCLPNWVDIIVYRLGEADDRQFMLHMLEVGGKFRRRRVGVVTANRMKNGNLVASQLLACDGKRVVLLRDETPLHAVRLVLQTHTAVS